MKQLNGGYKMETTELIELMISQTKDIQDKLLELYKIEYERKIAKAKK